MVGPKQQTKSTEEKEGWHKAENISAYPPYFPQTVNIKKKKRGGGVHPKWECQGKEANLYFKNSYTSI